PGSPAHNGGRCARRAARRFRGRRFHRAGGDARGGALRLYLDSSAIVKLVRKEPESEVLRRYLRRHRSDQGVTSALSRVEVVRAVQAGGAVAVAKAHRQLGRLHQISLDTALLDSAASLAPGVLLRTLDAI